MRRTKCFSVKRNKPTGGSIDNEMNEEKNKEKEKYLEERRSKLEKQQ